MLFRLLAPIAPLLYTLAPLVAFAAVEPPVPMDMPSVWENLARTPFILALCFIVWLFIKDRQTRDKQMQDQTVLVIQALKDRADADAVLAKSLDRLTEAVEDITK